ncbi:MAG TPA: DUF2264 domain-containing protein [Vicinamibacterales bacterium]
MKVNRRQALQAAGAALVAPRLAFARPHAPDASFVTQAPIPAERRPEMRPLLDAAVPRVAIWGKYAAKLTEPVLQNLAAGTLRARMPVEQAPNTDRRSVTHLEAFGRLLAGIGPWLESGGAPAYPQLALQALDRAVDPKSPDFLNFTRERQPLVDAAFLVQGLLRAPTSLLAKIEGTTRTNLIAALESTRIISPAFSNWLLFTAMVEAGLNALGAPFDATRVEYAVREHEQWYKGDGAYGDGPSFHWDYYNSFVIQPMLVDVAAALSARVPAVKDMAARIDERAKRYAAVQERMIGPDGTFPPIGRSLAYRCGAFHALAQAALRGALPDGVAPAQVRGALTAVIRRTLDAPDTFDADGWLRIGFCGRQPGVGETYISTGSLYLCSVALLPLGLHWSDPFWSGPDVPFTQQRAWTGESFPIDHALA